MLTYVQKTSQDVSYMTFWDETALHGLIWPCVGTLMCGIVYLEDH